MALFDCPYFRKQTKIAPLAVFRIFFGLMMSISVIRFWANGWIEKLYIEPRFFFSYYGFEWVKPLGSWTYLLFIVCGISAMMIAFGYKYRGSIVVFFLSFTYIELMDKTTYLNHYYFISVLSFLMIFLPAEKHFSIDAKRAGSYEFVPQWSVDSIKLLLAIVYFYAGLAKLNSDWLIHGMPLKIWLSGRYDLSFLGPLLHKEWVIYVFSWGSAVYDLSISFLLFWKRTRFTAFVLVVIFHLFTGLLFPIGMFPYIMIVSTLIFFDAGFHERMIATIKKLLNCFTAKRPSASLEMTGKGEIMRTSRYKLVIIATFLMIQLLFPWRYLLYPGELFWTEEGFRFSWRVMLMEKAGRADFRIKNMETGAQFYVDNSDFLTSFQEKQMAFQPDFILEYTHHLKSHFESQGHENIAIYVDSFVALNGRISRRFIDSEINLAEVKESFTHKYWILPFRDEIKGL